MVGFLVLCAAAIVAGLVVASHYNVLDTVKAILDAASLIVAVIGGVVAAAKGLWEMQEARKYKATEAADAFMQRVDEDPVVQEAVKMLDFNGDDGVTIKDPATGVEHTVNAPYIVLSMVDNFVKDDKMAIRRCFDQLLMWFERAEIALQNKLFDFSDIQPFFWYRVQLMLTSKVRFNLNNRSVDARYWDTLVEEALLCDVGALDEAASDLRATPTRTVSAFKYYAMLYRYYLAVDFLRRFETDGSSNGPANSSIASKAAIERKGQLALCEPVDFEEPSF